MGLRELSAFLFRRGWNLLVDVGNDSARVRGQQRIDAGFGEKAGIELQVAQALIENLPLSFRLLARCFYSDEVGRPGLAPWIGARHFPFVVEPRSGRCWKGSALLGALKLSISRDEIACGLVRERPEKVAEADVRSAYIRSHGENGQRLEIDMTPNEIDEEKIRWMDSISDLASMPSD